MKTMTKFIAAAAAAVALSAASGVSAAVPITPINQASLNLFGTSNFGDVLVATGPFSQTFDFTTTGDNDASSFVGTIALASGGKNIDFSAIDLDGTFNFVKTSGADLNEQWELATAFLSAGTHAIHVYGDVLTTSANDAASYSGTLNLSPAAVPEPATWGLMIMGFGGMGAVLRRRRQATAFA
jgi:opacity protein-like surface antigen